MMVETASAAMEGGGQRPAVLWVSGGAGDVGSGDDSGGVGGGDGGSGGTGGQGGQGGGGSDRHGAGCHPFVWDATPSSGTPPLRLGRHPFVWDATLFVWDAS